MTKFVPPGFNEAEVLEGLRRAMGFGEPTRVEDKATFFLFATVSAGEVDSDSVGFDPTVRTTRTPTPVLVPCAVEYMDAAAQQETFGNVTASRLKITLLDPDYQQVEGFSYMTIGGGRYHYAKALPPVALGTIDVWTVLVTAEDER